MEIDEKKKALSDYADGINAERKAIKTSYTRIATALANLKTLEDKWISTGTTIETELTDISNSAVQAIYLGELQELRSSRDSLISVLEALDVAVTAAGLMMI